MRTLFQTLATAFGLFAGTAVSWAGESAAVTPCTATVMVTLHPDETVSVGQWTVDGVVAGSEIEVSLKDIGAAIDARTRGNRDCRIMVRVERDVIYGGVMIYLQALQDAGYAKVALVAEEAVAPP